MKLTEFLEGNPSYMAHEIVCPECDTPNVLYSKSNEGSTQSAYVYDACNCGERLEFEVPA